VNIRTPLPLPRSCCAVLACAEKLEHGAEDCISPRLAVALPAGSSRAVVEIRRRASRLVRCVIRKRRRWLATTGAGTAHCRTRIRSGADRSAARDTGCHRQLGIATLWDEGPQGRPSRAAVFSNPCNARRHRERAAGFRSGRTEPRGQYSLVALERPLCLFHRAQRRHGGCGCRVHRAAAVRGRAMSGCQRAGASAAQASRRAWGRQQSYHLRGAALAAAAGVLPRCGVLAIGEAASAVAAQCAGWKQNNGRKVMAHPSADTRIERRSRNVVTWVAWVRVTLTRVIPAPQRRSGSAVGRGGTHGSGRTGARAPAAGALCADPGAVSSLHCEGEQASQRSSIWVANGSPAAARTRRPTRGGVGAGRADYLATQSSSASLQRGCTYSKARHYRPLSGIVPSLPQMADQSPLSASALTESIRCVLPRHWPHAFRNVQDSAQAHAAAACGLRAARATAAAAVRPCNQV
jgi:hypothetical protein